MMALDNHVLHDAEGSRGQNPQRRAFTIREANGRDGPRYSHHMEQLVTETAFMLQGPDDVRPHPTEQRLILGHIQQQSNCICLIAFSSPNERRQPILGNVTCLGGRTQCTQHVAQLSMGVVKHAWRQGIGGALLDAAMGWARQQPSLMRIRLLVYEENAPARRLYESRGFVSEGLLEGDALHGDRYLNLVGMSVDVALGDAP